jgi:hypothetical protein
VRGPALEEQQGEDEGEGEGEQEPVGSGVAGLFVTGPGFGRGGVQGTSPPPGSGQRPAPAPSAGCLLHTRRLNAPDARGAVFAVVLRELRMGRECSFGGRAVRVERRPSQAGGFARRNGASGNAQDVTVQEVQAVSRWGLSQTGPSRAARRTLLPLRGTARHDSGQAPLTLGAAPSRTPPRPGADR